MDRPRTDESDLLCNAISLPGSMLRQRSHLRTAFDLKHADGVGTLNGPINIVIFRQLGEVNPVAIELGNQVEAICENSHHAQAKQIDLDDVHVCTILFVPLDDRPTWHGRAFQRHNLIELSLTDHHATAMLPKVTGQPLNTHGNFKCLGDPGICQVEACILIGARHRVVWAAPLPIAYTSRHLVQRIWIEDP